MVEVKDMRQLFVLALKIEPPWRVADFQFDWERKRVDLVLKFSKGSRFRCPECDLECEVLDTADRQTWRQMDVMLYQAYATACLPRVRCSEHGVLGLKPSWAREHMGPVTLARLLPGLDSAGQAAAVAAGRAEHEQTP
jgi:transposase